MAVDQLLTCKACCLHTLLLPAGVHEEASAEVQWLAHARRCLATRLQTATTAQPAAFSTFPASGRPAYSLWPEMTPSCGVSPANDHKS
jgi:hypothetical protein